MVLGNDKTKETIFGYLKKAPELAAIIAIVWFFLGAQEKRDVLLREMTAEWKAVIERNTSEWKEASMRLERLDAWWVSATRSWNQGAPAGPAIPPPAVIPKTTIQTPILER